MKLNKAPCGVAQTVAIAKGNSVPNDGEDGMKGGILKGTKYAWLCQGPFLKIIDVSNGEKIAGWRFGASCSEFVTDVSCVVELPYNDDTCNLKQIVLGLECEVIGGMICIFDVQGSRLLRAIRIPAKPLSLSIVDSGSSGCEGRYPLPGLLSSMSGIIAVGLQGGSVFLIDLCRFSCEELLNTWFNDDREEVHDEMNPCQLLPINKEDDNSGTLEKKCATAAVSGDHLCLHLNESAFSEDNFVLLESDGKVSACFKSRNVGVTSLLYVPRIASLIVGYSFGCFQLWNLMHLKLNYSSQMMKDPLPVMHLGFQEPSDDPCNFCYLWTVHSTTDDFPSSSTPVGIMYALSYDSKEWVDGYGCLYQDYQSCHFRFEYNLEVDASEDVDSIVCVSFNTLSNVTAQKNMPEDGYDEVTTENDFSLCLFAWEAYDSENKPISTYVSLFDLNQWYKDQMPIRITETDDENLGYLVAFSLNCIRQKGEGVSQMYSPLLDIQVDPQNLSQFKSFQPQEEHFHPSALSFVSHCLLEDKIVSLSHPGLQRYLLLYMEKEGPICLLRPLNLFKHCVMVGLKPVLVDVNGGSDVPAVAQREFLLSVALENQMLGFLHRCASDWANGSVSGVDCSLPMLLSWGFQRAVVLKETADGLCVHLFDHTGIRLDKNECRLLDNCASQLRQLATLFEGILGDCRLFSLLNLEDFKQKTNELAMVALYFEVLLWFLNVGLLPEFPENDFDHEPSNFSDVSVDKIPYPSTVLTKFYTDRRNEFKTLNLKSGTKASLYIDQLLQNEANGSELADLWQSDGGSGMYPPPSIQSLLAMYLQDGIDIQTKNSIVIYVFLDLATLLDTERYSRTIEYFVKFPCAFCMTPSIIKVTQAFWLLDQKHFEDALDMVLDPLVSPKDLQPWQHRFIVHALLCQGQHGKALEYFTVRQLPIQGIEDIQLKITLLVMNKQITQAYNFLQQYRNEENNRELLYHFYEECGKVQQLGTVLKLMLSPAEEELLMNYLQNCSIGQSDDMQVVFYLMRSRVIEAVAVNERINFSGTRKLGGRRPRNDPTVRDVLVGGYAKTLPSVTRQLANYCSQQKKSLSNWRQVQRPTPMSVDVHYGTKQPVSYKSSLIHATLEKARETWMIPFHGPYGSEARNKDDMDVTAMQNLPFLCTSHDTLRHDRETTPVVFPSVTSNSIKRRLDEDAPHMATPVKRSRLENMSPVESFLLLSNKKKCMLEPPASNASLLLKSPLVKRITPLKQFNDHSPHEKNGSKPFAETFTPQSILKVRNLVRSSTSPEHQTRGFPNNDTFPRDLNQDKQSEERSCARQIRFSLPAVKDMEVNKPLSSSTPAAKQLKTPNRIVDASARLPIRSSLSLLRKSITEEVSQNDISENTWIQKDSGNEKGNKDNIFIFGSASSTNSASIANVKMDKIYSDVGTNKLNDSQGEESFYSAASSSDSVTSKSDTKEDSDDCEIPQSHQSEKYIHDIKEIKPRRQLSRVKTGSQSNLTDNFVCEEREISNEGENERYSCSEDEDNETCVSQNILDNFPSKKSFIVESEKRQLYFFEEQDDFSNDCDENLDSLDEVGQRSISGESQRKEHISSSEENSNESEDISIVNITDHKRSIFGDSFIGNNEMSYEQNEDLSYDEDVSHTDESEVSSANKTQALNDEIPEPTQDNSILKIQEIKARRPLSRLRTSGKFDASLNSPVSERGRHSYLQLSLSKIDDVLTDNTNIEISHMEVDEEGEENDDNNCLSGDGVTINVENNTVAIETSGIAEAAEEEKSSLDSLPVLAENNQHLSISVPIDGKTLVIHEETGVMSSDNAHTIHLPDREEQQIYFEENTNLVLKEGHTYQSVNTANINRKDKYSKDGKVVEFVFDGEKTYASLSAVTTGQSSYEHLLPIHHISTDQNILISPGIGMVAEERIYHTPLTPVNTDYGIVASHSFLTERTVSSVNDGDRQNEVVENMEIIVDRSSSPAAGDTSGTIEIDSDESEEKNNVRENVEKEGEIEQIIVEDNVHKNLEDSYAKKENVLLSTVNMQDMQGEINHSNDEIIVVDSDSESNKIVGSNQDECILVTNSESFENRKREKHRRNEHGSVISEQDLHKKDKANETPLVLKLSDSESDSDSSSDDSSEESSETNKENAPSSVSFSQSHLENRSCNVLPPVSSLLDIKVSKGKGSEFIKEPLCDGIEMHNKSDTEDLKFSNDRLANTKNKQDDATDMNVVYEGSNKQIEESPVHNVFFEDHVVPAEAVTLTNQSCQHSSQNAGEMNSAYSTQSKLSEASDALTLALGNKSDVEIVMQNLLPTTKQVSNSSSKNDVLQNSGDFIVEKKQTVSETAEEHYTLRCRQRSRPSSIQSEPAQLSDVSVSERESGQEHCIVQNRPRRRRSSLQIEPVYMNDMLKTESTGSMQEGKESSTPKTRQRSRPSSVQSEPPHMIDVCNSENQSRDQDVEVPHVHSGMSTRHRRRRSSLQCESAEGDVLVSENKVDLSAITETATSRTRQRNRPSSVQSEPPQISDVCMSEKQSKDLQDLHFSVVLSRQRKSSSLHIESSKVDNVLISENKGDTEILGECSTLKNRGRKHSSSASEPSLMEDVAIPPDKNQTVQLSQENSEESSRPRRGRSSSIIETMQMDDTSTEENKESFPLREENSTPKRRQRSRPSSVQSEPPEITHVSFEAKVQKQRHEKRRSSLSESEVQSSLSVPNISVPRKVPESFVLSHSSDLHPPTSSEPEMLKMNLRSHRSLSVEREQCCSSVLGGKADDLEHLSDSDTYSVQSEPPLLRDVSQGRQLRSLKSRKVLLRKKSRKGTYILKIPSSKLACVKEEPENECPVGDTDALVPSAQSESEMSPAFVTLRSLRNRKHSESASSQTGSVGEGRQLGSSHGDGDARADSPISISSKSTVILDKTSKRKRSTSPGSPEEQEIKKFLKDEQISSSSANVPGRPSSGKTAERKYTNSDDAIEQYATARRLTRYQKTLMERTMEVTKGVHHEFHGSHPQPERSAEDSDGESEASGYTSGSSNIRSSARLQEKKQMMMDRSPSQSSRVSVSGDHTPQKRVSRHHSPVAHSAVEHDGSSPASVRSGRSAGYASSVSSSQWPSPTSTHPQSALKPSRPRRKSFQNAQRALFSPSTRKPSSATTDTSEAESVGDNDEKATEVKKSKNKVEVESASESGSVRSQSSAVSSTRSRTTHSSAVNLEHGELSKSRIHSKAGNIVDLPQRELRERKVISSGTSSSTEDSPKKGTMTQDSRPTSEENQRPARESQLPKEKPEVHKSYSAFKTRKYLKIHSKRKSAM